MDGEDFGEPPADHTGNNSCPKGDQFGTVSGPPKHPMPEPTRVWVAPDWGVDRTAGRGEKVNNPLRMVSEVTLMLAGRQASQMKARLDRICADYQESRQETEEALKETREALNASLQERLWRAVCWRDYQLAQAERTHQAEQEAIEAEAAAERAQLKEALLGEFLGRRQGLLEEREWLLASMASGTDGANGVEDDSIIPSNGLVLPDSQATGTASGRQSRRTAKSTASTTAAPTITTLKGATVLEAPGAPATTTGSKRRGGAVSGTSVLGMVTLLPDHEIYEDLNSIARAGGVISEEGASGRRNAPRNPKTTQQPGGGRKRNAAAANGDSTAPSPQLKAPRMAEGTPADDTASAAAATMEGQPDIYIDGHSLWYLGSEYAKGSTFALSLGPVSDPARILSVTLHQVVVKKGSGEKVRIPLADLMSGAALILDSNGGKGASRKV